MDKDKENEQYKKLQRICGVSQNSDSDTLDAFNDYYCKNSHNLEAATKEGFEKYCKKRNGSPECAKKEIPFSSLYWANNENGQPIEEMFADSHPENSNSAACEEKTQQSVEEKALWEKIRRICNNLDEKTKNRLFVICLKFDNTIDSWATKPPSEWKPKLKEKFNDKYPGNIKSYKYGKEHTAEEKEETKHIHNSRPGYEQKRAFLCQELQEGYAWVEILKKYFMQESKEELYCSGKKAMQTKYAQYYELAGFGARPSHEKQNVLEYFKPLFPSETKWKKFKEDLDCVQITAELSDTGEKAYSYRDRLILPALDLKPCQPDYEALIQLSGILEFFTKNGLHDFPLTDQQRKSLLEFKGHVAECKVCKKELREFAEAFQYRKDTLQNKSWEHLLYPKHLYSKEASMRTHKQDCIDYYEQRCRSYPAPLNSYFLETARKLANKTKENQMRQQTSLPQNDTRNLLGQDYILSVRCLCGAETNYPLNHLLLNKVLFGRLQEDDVKIATINVCPDDNKHLSREMIQFEYDKNSNDWVISACGANEEFRRKKGSQIHYISLHDLQRVLDEQTAKTPFGEKVSCKPQWADTFTLLNGKRVSLRDVAGIGLYKIPDNSPLKFHRSDISGIDHPLMGKLPFGWYIEVLPRGRNQAIKSFLDKTRAVANEQEESSSILTVDTPTIIE